MFIEQPLNDVVKRVSWLLPCVKPSPVAFTYTDFCSLIRHPFTPIVTVDNKSTYITKVTSVYLVNQVYNGYIGYKFICFPPKEMLMTRDATEVIRVTPETWQRLNARKEPGDTFNDVVERLLNDAEAGNAQGMTLETAD